jgi:hypothetical protein
MVEIIGLVMIGLLIWLLSWAMARESDAERRRIVSVGKVTESAGVDLTPTRRAA